MNPDDREDIPADDLAGIARWMIQQRATEATPNDQISFIPLPVEEAARLFPDFSGISLIGQGGMGVVYRATQIKLGREVAIKILSPEKKRDAGFRERFAREALSMAQMDHPNIVSIYETGSREDHFYIVMEYVPGCTLREAITAGDLSHQEIITQICAGLAHAHERGVLHRDLKPGNILLREDGLIKIADFGLAKLLDETKSDFTLTLTDSALGTPAYMAPEQTHSLRDVDHRADIYSLGVVCYEMLTGKVPAGNFDPPTKDPHLSGIILKALHQDPDKRFQSITGFSQALARPPHPIRRWLKPMLIVTVITALLSAFLLREKTPPDLTKNSLGMEFTPIPGTNLYISKWETRLADFRAFIEASDSHAMGSMLSFDPDSPTLALRDLGHQWNSPGFTQNDDHPVVGIHQQDAIAFCQWLTRHEQKLGHLSANQRYRLPTDKEWTIASGLNENPPAEDPINHALTDYLPWDEFKPPPPGSGNFADTSAWQLYPRLPILTGYQDGAPATSPVDETMLGNTWEWTSDSTIRGASWTTGTFRNILPGLRIKVPATIRRHDIGFRCLLETR